MRREGNDARANALEERTASVPRTNHSRCAFGRPLLMAKSVAKNVKKIREVYEFGVGHSERTAYGKGEVEKLAAKQRLGQVAVYRARQFARSSRKRMWNAFASSAAETAILLYGLSMSCVGCFANVRLLARGCVPCISWYARTIRSETRRSALASWSASFKRSRWAFLASLSSLR